MYDQTTIDPWAKAERVRLTDRRELDSRVSDGIAVQLLWERATDRTVVAVHDEKTGERFELYVRDGQSAGDVFRHPYAYAAV